MMSRRLMLLAALLMLGADKPEPEPKTPPPKAHIRGTVKMMSALRRAGGVTRFLIEGKMEKDTRYDKAWVAVKKGVPIRLWKGGKKIEAKLSDLTVGCVAQVVFTGPVAESYPVQATASEVLILSPAKK